MIPILYEKDETAFASNGLGRLRDCISCVCREERNGVYEVDFEYPIDGVNYDRIQCGRIIAVEHDESNDVQPFDIVGYSRPINGVVTFHAVHISYRQTALTVSGTNINSLADAFTLLGNAEPSNPFNYWTDKDSTGYMASGDGIPHSVRSILGGMEGSILDAYGGEYEWDTWTVKLWASRGSLKNFTIRYGVNLTDYSEDTDYTDTYTSVIPYWVGQDADGNALTIIGDRQESGYPSFNGTERCIPIDVTDKFDSEGGQPTKAQVEAEGLVYIQQNQPFLPAQTIKVDFVRISDSPEYAQFKSLQTCKLCDSVNVMFPRYNVEGTFKIVKTEYDVLNERYLTLELGTLSISLATALGINSGGSYYVSVGGGGGSGGAIVGEIKAYGGSTAPTGWLLCQGQAVSRSTYATLFSVIGTTYGSGDGSTTFNVPDFRGRVPIGSGTGTATDATAHSLGSTGGAETHTLKINEMPSHNHNTIMRNSGSNAYYEPYPPFTAAGATSSSPAPVQNTGGGQAHNNLQPFTTINFIIKA